MLTQTGFSAHCLISCCLISGNEPARKQSGTSSLRIPAHILGLPHSLAGSQVSEGTINSLSAVAPGTPRPTVQGVRHLPLPLEKHTISQTKTTQHFTPWLPHSCNTVPKQIPILSMVPTCKMGEQLCRTEEASSQAQNPTRVPAPNSQAPFPTVGPVRTGHSFPPSCWIGTPSSCTTSTAFWQHSSETTNDFLTTSSAKIKPLLTGKHLAQIQQKLYICSQERRHLLKLKRRKYKKVQSVRA